MFGEFWVRRIGSGGCCGGGGALLLPRLLAINRDGTKKASCSSSFIIYRIVSVAIIVPGGVGEGTEIS